MLKFLRKNTKIIVWIVVIAFAGWGGYAVRLQFEDANRSPGRVFGKEVSFRDYLFAGQIVELFYAPDKTAETLPSVKEVQAKIWQFLVLSKEARKQKINVSDEEVRQEIIRILGGNDKQSFSSEQYSAWIRGQFKTEPREFENQVRENLRVKKLLDEIRRGFPDNPDERMKNWLVNLIQEARPQIYPARS